MIMQLRAQGSASKLGDHTDAAVQALSSGFADATRLSLLIAAAFLVLGFVGALRLRVVDRRARELAGAGRAGQGDHVDGNDNGNAGNSGRSGDSSGGGEGDAGRDGDDVAVTPAADV